MAAGVVFFYFFICIDKCQLADIFMAIGKTIKRYMFDLLVGRWATAYEHGAAIEEHLDKAVSFKYSEKECFDVKRYGSEGFMKCDALLDQPPVAGVGYCEYGFSFDGRPCFIAEVYPDASKSVGYFN